MRRFLVIIMVLGIAVLPLTSCSLVKSQNATVSATNGAISPGSGTSVNALASSESDTTANAQASSGSDTAANAQAGSGSDTAANAPVGSNPTDTTASGSSVQGTAETSGNPVDDSMTLESIKKGAQDAGFMVEDNQDMQKNVEPKPVNGFNISYKDENSQSTIPVYEFSDSAGAQKYADKVNKSGYNLCIINGEFLALTGSRYGIVQNANEQKLLETLLRNKFMVYAEPDLTQVSTDKNYAGACSRIDAISKTLDKLINKSVLIYGKSLPLSDPKNISMISFALVQSGDLSYTSTLSEDQAKMDMVVKTWEYFGCTDVKLKHEVANDYTLTGKRAGVDAPFAIQCVYNPDKDSLLLIEKSGKVASELFEFVPLGEDRYAFQTLYERAIVGYKDGKITSLAYSQKTRTAETAYNPDTDSIFPNGTGIDEAWVSKLGEDGYEQFITFDGTKLQISGVSFTGEKLKAEINVQ